MQVAGTSAIVHLINLPTRQTAAARQASIILLQTIRTAVRMNCQADQRV